MSAADIAMPAPDRRGPSGLDVPIRWTGFKDFAAAHKTEGEAPLRALVPMLRDTRGVAKSALPWIKLATFGDLRTEKQSLRHDANITAIHGVEADYDGESITVERAVQVLSRAGLAAVIYTSPSHSTDRPRWRILCPCSTGLAPSARTHLVARLNGLFVGALAAESFTTSQAYYYGALYGSTDHAVAIVEGRCIDLAHDLDGQAVGKPERPRAALSDTGPAPRPRSITDGDGTPWGLAALSRECQAIRAAGKGEKWRTINRAAYAIGGLVACGELLEGPAHAALRDAVYGLRDQCEDFDHALDTLRVGFEDGMAQPRSAPPRREWIMPDRPEPPPYEAVPEHVYGEPDATPDAPAPLTDGGKPNVLPLVYWNDIAPALGGDDFVEGLLIKGGMSVIYGPSNCGKTFWTSDLALHVATGRKWNGRDVEAGGVIYCALEGSYGIQNRVAAWRKHNGLEGVEVPFAVIPVAVDMLDPAADTERVIDAIRAAAAEMGVPVVWTIFDTLSRAMAGGNENSPEDMGALVTNGTRVQQVARCHVSWVHHCGKDQAQGARGHSLLRAATDTEIEISRPDKDSPSTARVTKQREMEIDGEWTFSLRTVELGQNRRGKPVTSCIVTPAEAVVQTSARLSHGAKFGIVALHNAIAASGQAPVSRDIPNWARVVPLEVWRREFYARSHLDSQEAKKKAFQRAIKDLRDAEVIGVMHDQVWLTDAN